MSLVAVRPFGATCRLWGSRAICTPRSVPPDVQSPGDRGEKVAAHNHIAPLAIVAAERRKVAQGDWSSAAVWRRAGGVRSRPSAESTTRCFLVRKLRLPGQEELAMGAIASGGVTVLNSEVVDTLRIPDQIIEQIVAQEQRELERRERLYRGDRPPPDVRNKTVILVDGGLATGSTIRAAVAALREQEPDRIVVAVLAAAPETCDEFRDTVDDIVCAITPDPFYAVGLWYEDFSQTTDDEVRDLLSRAAIAHPAAARERGGA
jgi:putative phosphoribosyl transferase